MTDTPIAARPIGRDDRMVILASSVGTVIEWYDFYLYGSLAAVTSAFSNTQRIERSSSMTQTGFIC